MVGKRLQQPPTAYCHYYTLVPVQKQIICEIHFNLLDKRWLKVVLFYGKENISRTIYTFTKQIFIMVTEKLVWYKLDLHTVEPFVK